MLSEEELVAILGAAWDDLGELSGEIEFEIVRGGEKFLGENAILDSIGLVTYISCIEDRLQALLGSELRIVTADTFARDPNPLMDLTSLKSYLTELVA